MRHLAMTIDREAIARAGYEAANEWDKDAYEWESAPEAIKGPWYRFADCILALLPQPQEPSEELAPIAPPENGETDPDWAKIKRSIDQFAGRVPTIGRNRAVNTAHIGEVVSRLDELGERAAADTIVWLCWHRALDRERERFLLADAKEIANG